MILKKNLIISIIIFSIIFVHPSEAYSPAPLPIKCNYITVDSEKNLSQISFEITNEGWILNWSKYNLFIIDSSEDLLNYSNVKIQIPLTIGTLAYGETHYLNSSDVITKEWINKTVSLCIEKSSGERLWGNSIIITNQSINKSYTIVDDYDAGKDLDKWGRWNPDDYSSFDSRFFLCIIPIISILIISIILIIYLIYSDRKKMI